MFKMETRRGTVVSIKASTPYSTEEVIENLKQDLMPLGYSVESATISEVRTTKIRRAFPKENEREFWREI